MISAYAYFDKSKPKILSLTLKELIISATLVANMLYQTNTYDRESLGPIEALTIAFFFAVFQMPKYKSNCSLVTED